MSASSARDLLFYQLRRRVDVHAFLAGSGGGFLFEPGESCPPFAQRLRLPQYECHRVSSSDS